MEGTMTRKFVISVGVILMLAVASNATGASGAEFHCSVEPCKATLKADGSGKVSHHSLIVKGGGVSASVTCNAISGEAESSKKTTSSVTLTNIKYSTCSINGTPGAEVTMNGCDYVFNASGQVTLVCPGGSTVIIELKLEIGCEIEIGPQGPLKSVSYTNINSKKEITVSTAVQNIVATSESCVAFGLPDGQYKESEYSTGNTIAFGEGGASVWWE